MTESTNTQIFRESRDFLIANSNDYEAAYRGFKLPKFDHFNWAMDWFDAISEGNDNIALWVVEQDGSEKKLSFAEMSKRSNQVANWMRSNGVERGHRVIVMLGNQIELWETILAVMKLGGIVIPATTLLGPNDLTDRIERGKAKHVVVGSDDVSKFAEVKGDYGKICVGEAVGGWLRYSDAYDISEQFSPDGVTRAQDTFLLYFTSGTTSKPKLVEHTHISYPVGHLSTMYWIGLKPNDVHLNISSPGWAKHAWSNFFAPWNAEATVLVYNYSRFDAPAMLDQLRRCQVSTFCAPPTVWRMLVQADLKSRPESLREVVSAGEPLNPQIIELVRSSWGLTIRDGYGQTETTAQIGNTPSQRIELGSMGRPLPGYVITLVDPISAKPSSDGEICLDLNTDPIGLMVGYRDDPELNQQAMRDGRYHTGDVASRNSEGYITYVGRTDDVFKASDYRISPFELESVLLEHDAVVEAAVVPSPDPIRLAVPKAYVTLAKGWSPDRKTALEILRYARENLAPYKRIRRLEFAELPKTISGKIRRVDLRARENQIHANNAKVEGEFCDDDFAELRS
ncbi:MAG: AMP-binding protein [Actinomycetota bacterium]|nr:AMP-binding protein [Actinomycetota bacterium]